MIEYTLYYATNRNHLGNDRWKPGNRWNASTRSRVVTIYYNRNDKAMWTSDYTKGNPERLGHTGAAHPALLHTKVHQVDCTPVVHDFIQHSYYLTGNINADIRASIDGWEQNDARRQRIPSSTQGNVWTMK